MDYKVTAQDVAFYMINKNPKNFDKYLPSIIKLQSLIFYGYLDYYVTYNKPLFNDEIRAYKYGLVVENVSKYYENLFITNSMESKLKEFKKIVLPKLLKDVLDSLDITVDIYMDSSAKELIELNHNLYCWRKYYNNPSLDDKVAYSDLKDDIEVSKRILRSYENTKKLNKIKFNSITYYWGDDLKMNDGIINELKEHSKYKGLDEDSYRVCYMEGELIIF